MLKNTFFLAIASALMVTSCTKKDLVKQTPDPEPVSAFTRTITYTNRGTQNEVSYDAAYKMETFAATENNGLNLIFIAGAKTPDSEGDAVALKIDADLLQGSPVKTYRFNATADAIRSARYTYTYQDANGGIRSSFTDSDMGVRFEGFVKVESYDPARKLISGTYQVEAKGLISDPRESRTSGPIDPMNQCDVTVTGSFSNVKVQNL